MTRQPLMEVLLRHSQQFHPVVPFNSAKEKLFLFDFTKNNPEIFDELINDTQKFTNYVNQKLRDAGAKFGIGGYGEYRELYKRSEVFDAELQPRRRPPLAPPKGENGAQPSLVDDADMQKQSSISGVRELGSPSLGESEGAPRRLHLGIDIWGRPYTPVMSPCDAVIHSFAFNDEFGDYGATIILSHNLDGIAFHTLYGHLSLNSIKNLREGGNVQTGDVIGEFGIPMENGQWPPHLHFQVIDEMGDWKGDYPGVCKYSEREFYLDNCPDPDLILGMIKFIDSRTGN
jgi:murein DD-endopeptidase MepM/ murein hydrolase activator NlpD